VIDPRVDWIFPAGITVAVPLVVIPTFPPEEVIVVLFEKFPEPESVMLPVA
jgi:hypothetical protein